MLKSATLTSEPGMPRFDLSLSLSMLDDDDDLLREMLTLFLNGYRDQLALIRTAILDNDPAALTRAAHRMKGTLSVFAIPELTNSAAELEARGKERTLDGTEQLLESLEQSIVEFAAVAQSTTGTPREEHRT
jgi:HPt (histidine-containing phosphotransfer) domain-containing protein